MTTHTVLRSRPRRALSVGLASALALGALGFIAPTTAQAAPVSTVKSGTISWGLRESFRSYVTGPIAEGEITPTAPATDSDGQTHFPGAVGSWSTGAAEVTAAGSVNFTGHAGVLDLTVSNPSIVIEAGGDAFLVVDAIDSDHNTHNDLKVARLDLAGHVTATETSVTIDGAPATLTQDGTALFRYDGRTLYPAGSTLDPVDATFTLAAEPKVVVSKTSFYDDETATVTVTGSGFVPDDAIGTRPPLAGVSGGVYIAAGTFAESWRPSAGAPSTARKTLAAPDGLKWAILAEKVGGTGLGVANGAIPLNADGTFTAELTLSKTLLDSIAGLDSAVHVNYGIYTYPGSGATNAAWEQYVPITFSAAPSETTPPVPDYVMTITRLVTDGDTRYGTSAKATATVTTKAGTPVTSGKVELSGHGSTQTANVVNGKVSFTLPRNVAVGTHTLTAIYSGEGLNLISTSTTRLTVGKANVTAKVSVSKKPTSKKTGTATVTIAGATGVTAPGGTAYVKFTKGKSSKTVKVTLGSGATSLTVPKLSKGTWNVSVKYNGDARYNALGYKKVTSTKVTK